MQTRAGRDPAPTKIKSMGQITKKKKRSFSKS
jgi:hypothetical protein